MCRESMYTTFHALGNLQAQQVADNVQRMFSLPLVVICRLHVLMVASRFVLMK